MTRETGQRKAVIFMAGRKEKGEAASGIKVDNEPNPKVSLKHSKKGKSTASR